MSKFKNFDFLLEKITKLDLDEFLPELQQEELIQKAYNIQNKKIKEIQKNSHSIKQKEYEDLFNSKEWDKYWHKTNNVNPKHVNKETGSVDSIIDMLEKKGVGKGQDIHDVNELNNVLSNLGLSDADKNKVRDNFKTRFDVDQPIKNIAKETVEESGENVAKQISKNQSKLTSTLKKHGIGFGLNAAFTVNTYNQAREEGDGVLKAGVKAVSDFAVGEVLGAWTPLFYLAKSSPQLAITAIEGTQSITRNMNNVSRTQVFGESQFQDTQQLATMRQAGMEMAKMSQYNLQQSIMGNEAQHMHRI